MTPPEPGPMTDRHLGDLLASSDATLGEYIRSRTDTDALVANLLDLLPGRSGPPPEAVMARVRLRQILGSLRRAEVHTVKLTGVLPSSRLLNELDAAMAETLDTAYADDLARVTELVPLLTRTMSHALGNVMSLPEAHDSEFEGYLSELIRALVASLARALADASDLTVELRRRPELIALAGTDLSGLELTGLAPGTVDLLYGFRWDERTVWPRGVAGRARAISDPVGEGSYRIRATAGIRLAVASP